jgi:hypothetical protein
MDGIIEALMLQHSPYSPHKRPLFEPPTPASCPADALPLPGLLVEVPPPLERLEPLRDPSRDLSPAAEPPQIDDLGASLEKLPQLKCSVKLETQEETPRQRGSRSRSKRVRKETARAFSSSPPGRPFRRTVFPVPTSSALSPHCLSCAKIPSPFAALCFLCQNLRPFRRTVFPVPESPALSLHCLSCARIPALLPHCLSCARMM